MFFMKRFCVRAKAELFLGWRFSASPKKREPETDLKGHAQKIIKKKGGEYPRQKKGFFPLFWYTLLIEFCISIH